MAIDELGLIRTLVRMGIPLSKLTQIPWLTTGLQGTGGLLNLIGGAQSGNVPQAIGGAASAGANAANLLDAPGVAGVLGNVAGPLGLATGLAHGNPMQAILGGVQTGSAASGYLGGPTISSLLSGLLGGGAEAGAAAGGVGAASVAPGIGSAGWALNPAVGMGGMMLMGGLMGKAADAEASGRAFRTSGAALNDVANQMRQVFQMGDDAFTPEQLPGTLSLIRDTLSNAPNLGLFTHTGRTDISGEEGDQMFAAIQKARAKTGQQWLRGLEAADAQGGNDEALRSPFRAREGTPTTLDFQGGHNQGLNTEVNVNLKQLAHLLDLTEPEAQQVRDAMASMSEGGTIHWSNVLENAAAGYNPALAKAFSPDRLAMLKDRIGFDPDKQGGNLDVDKVNKLFDDQWLTSTVHDAVRDVGLAKGMTHEQLAQAGISPDTWQSLAGGDVYGGGMNVEGGHMPSIAELSAFPGAGTGLTGLLASARGILGNDWLGGGLDAPYVKQWNQDLDWAGMPPRTPTGLPQPTDVNIGGGE